jgi:hypothetical protein
MIFSQLTGKMDFESLQAQRTLVIAGHWESLARGLQGTTITIRTMFGS